MPDSRMLLVCGSTRGDRGSAVSEPCAAGVDPTGSAEGTGFDSGGSAAVVSSRVGSVPATTVAVTRTRRSPAGPVRLTHPSNGPTAVPVTSTRRTGPSKRACSSVRDVSTVEASASGPPWTWTSSADVAPTGMSSKSTWLGEAVGAILSNSTAAACDTRRLSSSSSRRSRSTAPAPRRKLSWAAIRASSSTAPRRTPAVGW